MSTDKSIPPASHQAIIRSGAILSLGTMASRVLGFVRDVIFAHLLGTSMVAQAFFVALRIPNLFRDALGEGAANAAVVPVLCAHQDKGEANWKELVQVVMSWAFLFLTAVTIIGVLSSNWIVHAIAPGLAIDPQTFTLTVDLTQLMFPYLILIALAAVQMGVLSTLNSFVTIAFGPCLFNIALIGAAFLAVWQHWPLPQSLAIGVLVGGVAQFALQYAALARRGLAWRWPASLKHPGAIEVGKLLLPRLWGSMVYQMSVFVDTFCASLWMIVGDGGIAAVYFSNRLIQLPLGIFGYAMINASLPELSRNAESGKWDLFEGSVILGARNLLFVLVPSAVILMMLAPELIRLIFERGAFDAASTAVTANALFFFSVGLPFYGLARLMTSAHYAFKDTQTPVKTATICLIINLVLNFALMYPLKIGGIALASSIAALVNTMILARSLKKRMPEFNGHARAQMKLLIKPLIIFGLILSIVKFTVLSQSIVAIIVGIIVALVVYVAMGAILGIEAAVLIKRKILFFNRG